MLTRIEIDGFKSFEDFELDLGPLTVIMGGNASGKSNLFDAIQLLARLASTSDVRKALHGLRGDPYDLFRFTEGGERSDRMAFAVEVLLDPELQDPWGDTVELNHTRVRYEVELRRVTAPRGPERLAVTRERAVPLLSKEDPWLGDPRRPCAEFRKQLFRYQRRTPWLDTMADPEGLAFKIHQDGGAGRTRRRPAVSAEATVLSTMRTADFPHLYALRRELESWRLLQLDPFKLRQPSPFLFEDRLLLPNGSNVSAVLHRIREDTRSEAAPTGVLPELVASLAAIIPGVIDVTVERVEEAKEYRTTVHLKGGVTLPTGVVSDGTLRVLALLTLLSDPNHRGLVCFEEPENGIHPARLRGLLRRLGDFASNPHVATEHAGPLCQLVMNSHSPVVLSALRHPSASAGPVATILFADTVAVASRNHPVRTKTRMRPVSLDGQASLLREQAPTVTAHEVQQYLDTVDRGA